MADQMKDLLAEIIKPKVNWLVGRVYKINENGTCTLTYAGGYIYNVGSLDHYTPVVGDVVHALSFEPQGVLILGSNSNPTGIVPVDPVAQPSVIYSPISTATYTLATETWTPGSLQQGPEFMAAWRYDTEALMLMKDTVLQKVEIEITCVSDGPPELVRFIGDPPVVVPGPPWQVQQTAVNIPTWVPMAIGWGQELINGISDGIGITSSGQTGVYSGTGRVRLTPLSVTI